MYLDHTPNRGSPCYRFRTLSVPSCSMANETPKAPPEGKFAETLRKSREKRAGMKEQSEKRAQAQEESLQREEAQRLNQTFPTTRDSQS